MRSRLVLVVVALFAVVLAGCGGAGERAGPRAQKAAALSPQTGSATPTPGTTPTTTPTTAATPYVRVVAAGDIACPPGLAVTATQCQQLSTASWAARLQPRFVFPLGDTQYDRGAPAEYQGSYINSWGRLLSRTRPAIGNHEYATTGASGYYDYFAGRQPGPPGYYRAGTAGWSFYYLNSNCDRIDCNAEVRWLDQQMTANPARCTLITMHHARYSSGGAHGNDTAVAPLWRVALKHRADIVLAAHDHDYERFVRLDADGHTTRAGIQEFVVGTGGRNLYAAGRRQKGSAYFQNRTFGVLALDLYPGYAHWVYRAIDGHILDRGNSTCV